MYLNDVQIRLVILYTLKCFKVSMTDGDLQSALVWSEILDYFTMMDYLLDMEKSDLILDLTDDEKIDIVAKRILEKYYPAFKELAK